MWVGLSHRNFILRADSSLDGIAQHMLLYPAWVLCNASPDLVHPSPSRSIMVHTGNTLWKQQKLPPSPPVRAYTHTHTHIHTYRIAGGQSRINAGKGQGQKPSSLTSMQDRSYGTILFLRSVLDLAEATQPLKPHPCSSPFLLLPNRASLILFNIRKNSLFKSLTHESHFRFGF